MKKLFLFVVLCFLCVGVYLYYQTLPPRGAVLPIEIQYRNDEPLYLFIDALQEKKIIKNKKIFKLLLVATGYDTKLKPNIYTFDRPEHIAEVFYRIAKDSSQAHGVKVVIPEGSTVSEIQTITQKAFREFQPPQTTQAFFVADEGYLFPDTYFFSINSTENDIVLKLKDTFTLKTETLFIGKTEQEIRDIIIMASIIEKEGRNVEERKMISGILWKRIEIGMPLQVDATFLYTKGKGTSELTLDDLKEDSLYNTYIHTGLPVAPINNPGLETIEAALNPTPSAYLFYLHDKTGQIHYAKTFTEHIQNKNKYLK